MIIGLTGSMGAGKSTVAKILKENGFVIIDADEIARRVIAADKDLLMQLADAFGSEILDDEGELIRQGLAKRAFATDEGKKKLDSLMLHAIVETMKADLEELKQAGEKLIAVDAPLLFEVAFDEYCDVTWAIISDKENQVERVKRRDNLTASEIMDRISHQMSREELEAKADRIIHNNGSEMDLENEVLSLLIEYYEMSDQ